MLNNPTCQLPCWENIIPGKTPFDQAFLMFKTRNDIANIRNPMVYSGKKQIDFTWDFIDRASGGWIRSDENGELVDRIVLVTQYKILKLSQIIAAFKEPDHVIIKTKSDTFNRHETYFVYTNYRMVLGTETISQKNIITLNGDISISRITLYKAGVVEQFISDQSLLEVWDWQQNGNYTIPGQ